MVAPQRIICYSVHFSSTRGCTSHFSLIFSGIWPTNYCITVQNDEVTNTGGKKSGPNDIFLSFAVKRDIFRRASSSTTTTAINFTGKFPAANINIKVATESPRERLKIVKNYVLFMQIGKIACMQIVKCVYAAVCRDEESFIWRSIYRRRAHIYSLTTTAEWKKKLLEEQKRKNRLV